MTRLGKVALALLVTGMATAQTPVSTTSTTTTTTVKNPSKKVKTTKKTTATAEEVEALKAQMAAQQQQLDALKDQLSSRDQQLVTATQSTATAQQTAADATAKADAAAASAQAAQTQTTALQSTVTDLKNTDQGLQETVIANQAKINDEIESPSSIHYKGVTITPVAFFAFEGVWRERSTNSGLATPFNSIPMPSANEGHVSELNFSGRQSRLGGLFEGNAGSYKLSGYFEADFLSAGVTSNNNQSNSYTLRQRQIWGKAETASGFAVTGGQMWSLVTETGHSTDARTEKLPQTIDPNYMIGFSWMRQPGVRFQQRFGSVPTGQFTLAASFEQSQIQSFTANGSAAPANYFWGGAGAGGGLYNSTANYANNVTPDFIVKGTLDYTHAHFELGGLARFFRDYYFPITSAPGAAYTYSSQYYSNVKPAGGVFFSGRVSPAKFVDVALQGMAGEGVGRYGSAQLADATIRPDGTLEPIRAYHGLATIETHPAPKLDVFAYYGGEYAQRTVYAALSNGTLIGYGPNTLNNAGCYALPTNPGSSTGGSDTAPSTCASPTRYIQEGMLGFTYRFVNSPKYGRFQYSMTYQIINRALWSGTVAGSVVPNAPTGPRALDNMIHTSMRYYIP